MSTAPLALSQSSMVKPAGEWLTPRRFALLLSLLIAAMFWEVIVGTSTFFFRDYGFFGYPLAHYNREMIWRGEFPFWNPLSNCGLPYLAQWNTMLFYPPSLFHLLLPMPWSLGVFNLGHLFWAGLGMYFLAQRWAGSRLAAGVAGLAFAFNGLTLNCLMWPNNIASMAWLPWILWLLEKAWRNGGRDWWVATLGAAVQMLAGGAEVIAFTWGIAGLLWLLDFIRPRGIGRVVLLARFGFLSCLVFTLAALQLFPFLDLLIHSQRDGGFGDARWSMPQWGWANLVLPLFRTRLGHHGVYMQPDQYWTSSYYVGIGVLVLALGILPRGRSSWVWFAIGLGGLVVALGESGFLYGPLKTFFPSLGMMRFPVKFVVLAEVAFPVLAAQALAAYLRLPAEDWWNGFVRLTANALGVGLVLAGLLYWTQQHTSSSAGWSLTLQNGLVRAVILVLFVSTLYFLRQTRSWSGQMACSLGLLALIWIDLSSHVPNQNPTAPRLIYARDLVDDYLPRTPRPEVGSARAMLTPLAQQQLRFSSLPDPGQQYSSRRATLLNNCNLLDGIPKVNGFYSLYPPHHADLLRRLYQPTNVTSHGLLDFMGVSHLNAADDLFSWETRPHFLPMFVLGARPVFANEAITLAAVTEGTFDGRREVYLPENARAVIGFTNGSAGRILRSQFGAHSLEATVWSEGPNILTVAQTYYHCWEASVNGKRVPTWRANHAFQAISLPAGRSEVKLVYRERTFPAGLTLSCAAALVCLVGWRITPRRFPDRTAP